MPYVVGPWDREWFKRCRRAWDFGSRCRQDLERDPPAPAEADLDRALRDALAVYYFPGMWEWNRGIVVPLTFQALERALAGHPDALDAGREILTHYLEWAPTADNFWPVRVESDFVVQIPDPDRPGEDLVTPDGAREIRYEGRVDLLVVDEHDAYWIVRHRLAEDEFTDTELLVLDDEVLASCWAWEHFYIGMRVAGTIHNELRLDPVTPEGGEAIHRPRPARAWADARAAARGSGHRRMYARSETEPTGVSVEEGGGMFRRTRIPRSARELAAFGERLAAEAADMVNPGLPLYPTAAGHCAGCSFRSPCLVLNGGGDPAPLLAERYRPRPAAGPEEGRLGGASWSMNRGAAPPPQWRRKAPPG